MIGFEPLKGLVVGGVHTVRLPTFISVSKKTTKAANLNIYRNLHHHHLNKQKQTFHDDVKPSLSSLPKMKKIWIHYTIFAPRNGRLDTMNVGSIVDKYFSDTLVDCGKIEDDDYTHIVFSSFSFGGVCPLDGHAIATIYELKPEKERENMRILLDQDDIQTALDTFVQTMGLSGVTGVDLTVTDDGEIEAEVMMNGSQPKPKSKGGRPRGSKNKPKPVSTQEDTADADTDSEADSDGTDSAGSDAPATDTEEGSETAASKSGNPSGEEESQSSDSTETTTESDTPEEGTADQTVKPKKKSSIFDVD